MGRWTHVEPDHVAQLPGEARIVRELEAPPAMRGEAMGLPYLLDRGNRQSRDVGHGARGPVRRLEGRGLQRHRHDRRGLVVRDRGLSRRPGPVAQQTVDAFFHEAGLPTPDRGLRRSGLCHDG